MRSFLILSPVKGKGYVAFWFVSHHTFPVNKHKYHRAVWFRNSLLVSCLFPEATVVQASEGSFTCTCCPQAVFAFQGRLFLLHSLFFSLMPRFLFFTTRDHLIVLRGITTMKECGMNREIKVGIISARHPGTTSPILLGTTSLKRRGTTSTNNLHGVGVRGNLHFECNGHLTSEAHFLHISNIPNSTSPRIRIISTAFHLASCRMIFHLAIPLKGLLILIVLITPRGIFLKVKCAPGQVFLRRDADCHYKMIWFVLGGLSWVSRETLSLGFGKPLLTMQ